LPKRIYLLGPAIAAAVTCGCDTPSHQAAQRDMVIVTLAAAGRNAGESGRAILLPDEDATEVRIEVSGSVVPLTAPVELYTFIHAGTCASLSAKPAYRLIQRVQAQSITNPTSPIAVSGPFSLSNTAPVSLATLRSTPYAIVVKSSPADGNIELFCGDLK
jgi:hypothetical protein